MVPGLLMVALVVTSLLMIVLVLIQRGKGGGLAGAFGGMGGQSAFGTKAGDLFTKITIGLAIFWILLCLVSVRALSTKPAELLSQGLGSAAAEQKPGISAPPSTDKKAADKPADGKGTAAPAEKPKK